MENDTGSRRVRRFLLLHFVEYCVSMEYWNDHYQLFKWFRPGILPETITVRLFDVWHLLETLLATVGHGSVNSEMCMMDYDTTLCVTHDSLLDFYRQMQWVSDPNAMATFGMEACSELLRLSWLIRRAALDEYEIIAIQQLAVAYYGKPLFANVEGLQAFVNTVLHELHAHYASTYYDYYERLATLTSIMGEFHKVVKAHDELKTLKSLHRKTKLSHQNGSDLALTDLTLRS